jgi:hypothetical protein
MWMIGIKKQKIKIKWNKIRHWLPPLCEVAKNFSPFFCSSRSGQRERERERGNLPERDTERDGDYRRLSYGQCKEREREIERKSAIEGRWLYGGEISERERGGGGLQFNFPSNRFSSNKKKMKKIY